MRKLALLLLVLLTACSSQETTAVETPSPTTTATIEYELADMSEYGVDNSDGTYYYLSLTDLYQFIDNDQTGIVLLTMTGCEHCKRMIPYLTYVAREEGVKIYYVNILAEENNFRSDDELLRKAAYQECFTRLDPILETASDGEKTIYTPQVFQVNKGEFGSYNIGGIADFDYSDPESVDELLETYRELIKGY